MLTTNWTMSISIDIAQLLWQNFQWFHLSNCSLFLIRTHKTKEMITRFSRKFPIPNTFISFLAQKSSTLGVLLSHFGWTFTVRSDEFWLQFRFVTFAYRLNSRVYAFLRLCEGHITIPTDFHQLQSKRLRLKFLMNTTFLYKNKTANDEEKNANHRQLLVAHIYIEREIHTSCGSIKFNTLVSGITT